MESLKQEALKVISKKPDTAEIDGIMYRLYVIDKVRKRACPYFILSLNDNDEG